jgi:predicted permease
MILVVLFLLTVTALLASFFVVLNGTSENGYAYGFAELLMAANVTTETATQFNSTSTSTSTVAFISLRATAQLATAVAAGVLLARNGGILNAATVKGLSKLTYCMFQPALIFCSVSKTLQSESSESDQGEGGPGLSSLAILVLPIASLLQIAFGYSTGRLLTRIFRMPGGAEASGSDTKDVWMCTTFANSAPLPLVFADSLFADNLPMKADVIACISFYLLLWSPIFWTVGPRMLETKSAPDRELADVEYELDGSKNKGDSTSSASIPESPSRHRQHLTASSVEQMVRKILLTPPVIGSIMGVVVGTSPILQALCLRSDGLAAPVYGAAQTFASAYLPATILVLAGSMVAPADKGKAENEGNGLDRSTERLDDNDDDDDSTRKPMPSVSTPETGSSGSRQLSWRAISCIAVARFVINPILTSTILNVVSTRTKLLGPTDSRTCAVLSFVILMQGCMPPAQNSVVMLQMENQTGRATRMTTLLTILYCMAIVPVTFHMSRTLAATGVTAF